jgi:hypothetical protein
MVASIGEARSIMGGEPASSCGVPSRVVRLRVRIRRRSAFRNASYANAAPLANERHTQALVEVQAAAGVEPQIDMFGWVRKYARGAVHTQPVA